MSGALDTSWKRKSWIAAANDPQCGFPLQNLPFCAFEAPDGAQHLGVGIADLVLNLNACAGAKLLGGLSESMQRACGAPVLNALMSHSPDQLSQLRHQLMALLRDDAAHTSMNKLMPHLQPMAETAFRLPVHVGNYTDFYASVHHATNVGRLFRPDQPLLPNYKYVPIGYHGRASSIVLSGTGVRRPHGQLKPPNAAEPTFAITKQLDYELEVAAYIGQGNALGSPIAIVDAEQHFFGISLLNDWSARDIQAWEYQPLGPFLGKSFATTVSPWVVTREALAPYRAPLAPRAEADPGPLTYLRSPHPGLDGIDLQLEVHLRSAAMRERSMPHFKVSTANLLDLYWSFAQMIAHHTSNGCNLQPGDLLGSGTVSGATEASLGSLLEITKRGVAPLTLPTGEIRTFLEDGDEVTLTGSCRREGLPFISLGACTGILLPAG